MTNCQSPSSQKSEKVVLSDLMSLIVMMVFTQYLMVNISSMNYEPT